MRGSPMSLCQQADVNSSETVVAQPAMLSITGRELVEASKPWHQQLQASHTIDSCCCSPGCADPPVNV